MENCRQCPKLRKTIERKNNLVQLYKTYFEASNVQKYTKPQEQEHKLNIFFLEEVEIAADKVQLFYSEIRKLSQALEEKEEELLTAKTSETNTKKNADHISFVNKQLVDYHRLNEVALKQFKTYFTWCVNEILKKNRNNKKAKICLEFINNIGRQGIVDVLNKIKPDSNKETDIGLLKEKDNYFPSSSSTHSDSSGVNKTNGSSSENKFPEKPCTTDSPIFSPLLSVADSQNSVESNFDYDGLETALLGSKNDKLSPVTQSTSINSTSDKSENNFNEKFPTSVLKDYLNSSSEVVDPIPVTTDNKRCKAVRRPPSLSPDGQGGPGKNETKKRKDVEDPCPSPISMSPSREIGSGRSMNLKKIIFKEPSSEDALQKPSDTHFEKNSGSLPTANTHSKKISPRKKSSKKLPRKSKQLPSDKSNPNSPIVSPCSLESFEVNEKLESQIICAQDKNETLEEASGMSHPSSRSNSSPPTEPLSDFSITEIDNFIATSNSELLELNDLSTYLPNESSGSVSQLVNKQSSDDTKEATPSKTDNINESVRINDKQCHSSSAKLLEQVTTGPLNTLPEKDLNSGLENSIEGCVNEQISSGSEKSLQYMLEKTNSLNADDQKSQIKSIFDQEASQEGTPSEFTYEHSNPVPSEINDRCDKDSCLLEAKNNQCGYSNIFSTNPKQMSGLVQGKPNDSSGHNEPCDLPSLRVLIEENIPEMISPIKSLSSTKPLPKDNSLSFSELGNSETRNTECTFLSDKSNSSSIVFPSTSQSSKEPENYMNGSTSNHKVLPTQENNFCCKIFAKKFEPLSLCTSPQWKHESQIYSSYFHSFSRSLPVNQSAPLYMKQSPKDLCYVSQNINHAGDIIFRGSSVSNDLFHKPNTVKNQCETGITKELELNGEKVKVALAPTGESVNVSVNGQSVSIPLPITSSMKVPTSGTEKCFEDILESQTNDSFQTRSSDISSRAQEGLWTSWRHRPPGEKGRKELKPKIPPQPAVNCLLSFVTSRMTKLSLTEKREVSWLDKIFHEEDRKDDEVALFSERPPEKSRSLKQKMENENERKRDLDNRFSLRPAKIAKLEIPTSRQKKVPVHLVCLHTSPFSPFSAAHSESPSHEGTLGDNIPQETNNGPSFSKENPDHHKANENVSPQISNKSSCEPNTSLYCREDLLCSTKKPDHGEDAVSTMDSSEELRSEAKEKSEPFSSPTLDDHKTTTQKLNDNNKSFRLSSKRASQVEESRPSAVEADVVLSPSKNNQLKPFCEEIVNSPADKLDTSNLIVENNVNRTSKSLVKETDKKEKRRTSCENSLHEVSTTNKISESENSKFISIKSNLNVDFNLHTPSPSNKSKETFSDTFYNCNTTELSPEKVHCKEVKKNLSTKPNQNQGLKLPLKRHPPKVNSSPVKSDRSEEASSTFIHSTTNKKKVPLRKNSRSRSECFSPERVACEYFSENERSSNGPNYPESKNERVPKFAKKDKDCISNSPGKNKVSKPPLKKCHEAVTLPGVKSGTGSQNANNSEEIMANVEDKCEKALPCPKTRQRIAHNKSGLTPSPSPQLPPALKTSKAVPSFKVPIYLPSSGKSQENKSYVRIEKKLSRIFSLSIDSIRVPLSPISSPRLQGAEESESNNCGSPLESHVCENDVQINEKCEAEDRKGKEKTTAEKQGDKTFMELCLPIPEEISDCPTPLSLPSDLDVVGDCEDAVQVKEKCDANKGKGNSKNTTERQGDETCSSDSEEGKNCPTLSPMSPITSSHLQSPKSAIGSIFQEDDHPNTNNIYHETNTSQELSLMEDLRDDSETEDECESVSPRASSPFNVSSSETILPGQSKVQVEVSKTNAEEEKNKPESIKSKDFIVKESNSDQIDESLTKSEESEKTCLKLVEGDNMFIETPEDENANENHEKVSDSHKHQAPLAGVMITVPPQEQLEEDNILKHSTMNNEFLHPNAVNQSTINEESNQSLLNDFYLSDDEEDTEKNSIYVLEKPESQEFGKFECGVKEEVKTDQVEESSFLQNASAIVARVCDERDLSSENMEPQDTAKQHETAQHDFEANVTLSDCQTIPKITTPKPFFRKVFRPNILNIKSRRTSRVTCNSDVSKVENSSELPNELLTSNSEINKTQCVPPKHPESSSSKNSAQDSESTQGFIEDKESPTSQIGHNLDTSVSINEQLISPASSNENKKLRGSKPERHIPINPLLTTALHAVPTKRRATRSSLLHQQITGALKKNNLNSSVAEIDYTNGKTDKAYTNEGPNLKTSLENGSQDILMDGNCETKKNEESNKNNCHIDNQEEKFESCGRFHSNFPAWKGFYNDTISDPNHNQTISTSASSNLEQKDDAKEYDEEKSPTWKAASLKVYKRNSTPQNPVKKSQNNQPPLNYDYLLNSSYEKKYLSPLQIDLGGRREEELKPSRKEISGCKKTELFNENSDSQNSELNGTSFPISKLDERRIAEKRLFSYTSPSVSLQPPKKRAKIDFPSSSSTSPESCENEKTMICNTDVMSFSLQYFVDQEKMKPEPIESPGQGNKSVSDSFTKEVRRIFGASNVLQLQVIVKKVVTSVKKELAISPGDFSRTIVDLVNADGGTLDEDYFLSKAVKICAIFSIAYFGPVSSSFLIEALEKIEEYLGSFHRKQFSMEMGVKLARYYAYICQYYRLERRVKLLIMDIIYSHPVKAGGVILSLIEICPGVLLKRQSLQKKGCILTEVILFAIFTIKDKRLPPSKFSEKYSLNALKNHLFKAYQYSSKSVTNCTELFEKLLLQPPSHEVRVAMVLLCAVAFMDTTKKLIQEKLFPLLKSWLQGSLPEEMALHLTIALGMMVRGMPLAKSHLPNDAFDLLEDLLYNAPNARFAEGVIQALSYLRRHNLNRAALPLLRYKPASHQITSNTLPHVMRILSPRNIQVWRKFYLKFRNSQQTLNFISSNLSFLAQNASN